MLQIIGWSGAKQSLREAWFIRRSYLYSFIQTAQKICEKNGGVLGEYGPFRRGPFLLAAFVLFAFACASCGVLERSNFSGARENFNRGWLFKIDDDAQYFEASVDDSEWRQLSLPHDFSIEGELSEANPAGRRGGFFPGGVGWYRKHFEWDSSWTGKRVIVTFDGVMMRSDIFVNGARVGGRPYGYLGVSVDITEFLFRDRVNVIAVKADNKNLPSARWYTGSGIYRNAWLEVRNPIHLVQDGGWVKTLAVEPDQAVLSFSYEVKNNRNAPARVRVEAEHQSPSGRVTTLSFPEKIIGAQEVEVFELVSNIDEPALWSPSKPNLYQQTIRVFVDDMLVDQKEDRFGVRQIEIDLRRGLLINGEAIEVQGVCLHHDGGGAVGAAVPLDVQRKRLAQLKAMGVNSIRTGHTPFAPEFYHLADEMGFMIMDEIFDGWEVEKAEFDYGLYFEERWHEELRDFIRRDRKHPSVVFWSIGNEVRGQTAETQKMLVEAVRQLDDSRFITQGRGYSLGFDDIAGFNGHGEFVGAIEKYHSEFPHRPIIGTEITHTLHTRDVYRSKTEYRTRDNPAPWEFDREDGKTAKQIWESIKSKVYPNEDLTDHEVWPEEPRKYASSFDNNLARMSIRDQIRLSKELPYLLGTYRWTGFDYLGEAYAWPARTANFGVIDLAGFEKGPYYLYQSQWSDTPMAHLDPHWTHPGKEGVVMPVVVYTNLDEVELFLNGESLGSKVMGDEMQLVWKVPYESGVIKAVARGAGGEEAFSERRTASEPQTVKLTADRSALLADGQSVAHITIDIVDEFGIRVPSGDHRLKVAVQGAATLLGLENGDVYDLQNVKEDNRKAFRGKLMALVQSKRQAGDIAVTVSGAGLKSQTLQLSSNAVIEKGLGND